MENLSSIQISKDFKEVLRREKEELESFEDYIKRLRGFVFTGKNLSIDSSIEHSIDERRQSIDKNKLSIELNLNKITPELMDREFPILRSEQEIIGFTESGKPIFKRTDHLVKVKEIPICNFQVIRENIPFQIPIKDCLGDRILLQ